MSKRRYESCPPKPDAMINSLRAFGYDLPMAIADLIDNSIFAGARHVIVDYDWNNGKPWIRIDDDGSGMSESRLKQAMRLGSQNPAEDRDPQDLGRFGLGLKTASFSQGRALTVRTKSLEGDAALRSWDLDHVASSKRWELSTHAPRGAAELLSGLDAREHGTTVLWQKLDRVCREEDDFGGDRDEEAEEHFLNRFSDVAKYLEMVFHRYLVGKDLLSIKIGRHKCAAWDPFLQLNQFTQELSTERLDEGRVLVTPYVLPHVSKRSREETDLGGGISGWNAHQGFYLYRNRRMIVPGGYLDFGITPEEHFKLCRIRVDIPNDLDHDWSIDVRKATASPPSRVRRDLERIVKATRSKAVEIYRARTGASKNANRRNSTYDIWVRKKRGDKVLYEINKDHPVLERVLNELSPTKSWVKKLFHLIETTVPHRVIIQDNAEFEDCHVALPTSMAAPPQALIELCKKMFEEYVNSGRDPSDAADFVCALFDDHVEYRSTIDSMIEEMK